MVANPFRLTRCPHAAALLLATGLLTGCPQAPSGSSGTSVEPGVDLNAGLTTQRFQINGKTLTAELTLDPDTRLRGLSGRASLAEDRGMLFVFPREEKLAFVMRECLIPIDIAFIDASGTVVATHQMTLEPAGTAEGDLTPYPSERPALFALELAAGGLERYGLAPGVQLDLPVLELQRQAR